MALAETVIRCEQLSKQYALGRQPAAVTLRDAIASAAARVRVRGKAREPRETVWALRDVSFEVAQGDLVGIIGRNGAGKSTLLKILARVAEPTSGRARIRGRLGSLLEVGTGFHGELTGRENIFLNGAILGMRRSEIQRKFEEIVAFSEIEMFLDTPVKRYSSGMTVRLAFAVAAHLEPEILLVDEVLAVGDVGFQRKCIGKMSEVAGEGRTVLFVSHNMAVIESLCRRGIFLEQGRVQTDADVSDAVAAYLRSVEQAAFAALDERRDRRGWGEVWLSGVEASGPGGAQLATGRPARFVFHLSRADPRTLGRVSCAFTIVNDLGHPVATLDSAQAGSADAESESAETFVCEIDELPLVPGRYRIDVEIDGRSHVQDALEGAAMFDVEQGTIGGRPVSGERLGDVAVPHRWIAPSLD